VGRRFVATVALVCFGGCASTATITRSDSPDNEAQIVNSDAGALYVQARNGRIYRIGRESVTGIDHPGNVEILIGSLLLGVVGLIAVMARTQNDNEAIAPIALVYGSPGAVLLASGLYHYVPSVQAARVFETADPGVRSPPAGTWFPVPPPTQQQTPALPPPLPQRPVTPPPLEAPPPPEDAPPEVIPDATSPR
jgi:hypothetical protein